MKALQELTRFASKKDAIITLGVFDGVHLGHQHLLHCLKEKAQENQCESVIITFRNHPRAVLYGMPIPFITSLEERLRLLRAQGVDRVVPVTFDLELSRMPAEEFVSFLKEEMRMKGMVVGPDFALGYRREGNVPALKEMGRSLGFTVTVIDFLRLGDTRVSSTDIRHILTQGEVTLASKLLGRYFSLEGKVVPGEGRGRALGFPTANLEVPSEQLLPADGIYAAWAYVENRKFKAATSIGTNPTFGPGRRTIEAHLLDFQGEIYNKTLRLEFVKYLREEVAFPNPEELQAQMAQDVAQTRALLQEGGA